MANTRHLKRSCMPKSWKIQRKGITFISKPNSGSYKRKYVISVLVLLRDILEVTKNSKEAKFIVNNKTVLINGKQTKEIKAPIGFFDIVEIKETKEIYTFIFEKTGRVKLVKNPEKKLYLRVSNKTNLKNGKFQVNTMSGVNVLVNEKEFKSIKVQDTIVYDFEKKKIVKIIHLSEKASIYVFDGKFIGRFGEVTGFETFEGRGLDLVDFTSGKEKHKTAKKYCFAIDKEDLKKFEK
jgi:small subunit ribosomal protein S4e